MSTDSSAHDDDRARERADDPLRYDLHDAASLAVEHARRLLRAGVDLADAAALLVAAAAATEIERRRRRAPW